MALAKRGISLLTSILILVMMAALGAYELGLFKSHSSSASQIHAASGEPRTNIAAATVTPLHNNCSGGLVTFTFDDGPSMYTQSVIDTLLELRIKAEFFVIGARVHASPDLVREEDADGFIVGNHTYNHRSFTGLGSQTAALTLPQVAAELRAGSEAITGAGLAAPTLYRPPFDDVSSADNSVAAGLGLRVVMGYGNSPSNKVVDSDDWSGISPAEIVSRVDNGYEINGFHMPGIQGGSVVIFHDGQPTAPNVIAALPQIVTYMNAHHLCSTPYPPADATGGVISNNPKPLTEPVVPLPPVPAGNLVEKGAKL